MKLNILLVVYFFCRYIYVKTEQLGNQTGMLNGSCITYVIIMFGLVLTSSHWVCISYFIPIARFRYYQACMWPNNTYQPLLKSQGTLLQFSLDNIRLGNFIHQDVRFFSMIEFVIDFGFQGYLLLSWPRSQCTIF